MEALAVAMGYKQASSIQRYEDPASYKKDHLSTEFTLKLAKALVGKGTPPIEADEVWELARLHLPKNQRLIETYDPDAPDHVAGEYGFNGDYWKPTMPGALPEVDAEAGAGLGVVGEVVNVQVGNDAISAHKVVAEWYIPDQFLLHQAGASTRQSIVMEVRGDSMQPSFLPGDRVIVDLSQREFTVDGVYVFSDGHGEPQIKRLQKVMFSDPVVVRIISDNPAYGASDVELSRVHIIGRVRGHVGRM